MKQNFSIILNNFKSNCEKQNFKGYDVFDGLNSKIFKKTPFYHSRFCRLFWIQLFKKLPFNLRPLTFTPKTYNAKGLALFISGYINLYKTESKQEYLNSAYKLADIIISQKNKDRDYSCWGYNFYWEARAFSVPPFKPNMIVSSFVAQSLLDLFSIDKNKKWLLLAEDVAKFIETELILHETEKEICFAYIPEEKARVHNANLMGAKLFARLYNITGIEQYKQYAEKSVNYSVNAQREDGAWVYGERSHHQWVDNFHTGFNLVAINDVQKYLNIKNWQKAIDKGLEYHKNNHFLNDMTPKYFDNKTYPIDIHNFAQGIITFLTFNDIEKAEVLLNRCFKLMWSNNKHYFYYQKNKLYTNKINYIRWSQAWMFYAMSEFLLIKKQLK